MGRGPSYPYVDLEGAIAYTRKVYDFAKRGSAATEAVVKDGLKLSPTSSGSQKVIAALRAFGLIEDTPGADGKAVKISNSAIRILLDDPESAQRQAEIKKAALSPKWYEYCWAKWGKDMPPAMRSNLLIEHGFIESTVDGFLEDYRKTIAFAGLLDEVIFKKEDQSSDESKNRPKVGDYVQYELSGVLQFPAAQKLTHYSPKGDYAFVEGYLSGIPVDQLVAADPPEQIAPPAVAQQSALKNAILQAGYPTMRVESFSLSDGNSITVQWPSSITTADDAFEDFEEWLNLLKKKIKRAINKPEEKTGAGISHVSA